MIIQINPEDLCWGGHRTCQWSHLSVCHLSVAGSVAQPWCLDLCLSGHLKATHPHPNPQRSHNCSTASATPEGPPIPPALLFQPPSHVRRHPNPTALAYTLSILTAAHSTPLRAPAPIPTAHPIHEKISSTVHNEWHPEVHLSSDRRAPTSAQ